MPKIPYYIRSVQKATVENTEVFILDNNTDIAQTISYEDLIIQLQEQIQVPTDFKPLFLLQGC
jgi:hypothetical protein